MNDDVIDKVAEAMFRDAWPEADPTATDRQAYTQHAQAAVAAHTDYLLALGGVTDEDVFRAVEDWCAGERPDPIRALIARAVAQAVADKDAKLARVEALLDRVANVPNNVGSTGWGYRAYIDPDDLRAALADEDSRRCPECATVHPETECPA